MKLLLEKKTKFDELHKRPDCLLLSRPYRQAAPAIRAIGGGLSGLECQNKRDQPQGYGSVLHPPCAPLPRYSQGDRVSTRHQSFGYWYGRRISWHPAGDPISRYPLPPGGFDWQENYRGERSRQGSQIDQCRSTTGASRIASPEV